jgi:hypothetical protein
MINHARTLLLNVSPMIAAFNGTTHDGYEYVPTEFKPISLTQTLNIIRRVIFGINPDNFFRDSRAHELLSYIHQTELSEYVYALDPRVTYWPATTDNRFDPHKQTISVTQTYGDARQLVVTGDLKAGISSGTSYRSYVIALGKETANSTTLSLYVRLLEPPNTVLVVPYPVPAAPIVPLPESDLKVRAGNTLLRRVFNTVATELGNGIIIENYTQLGLPRLAIETPVNFSVAELAEIVAQWYVVTTAPPLPAVTTLIPILEMLGEPVFLDLFGVKPDEPYETFKNLWFDHPLPTYKLSGLVLALIYRAEELRLKNG